MQVMHNPIRRYPWGSRTALAELLGRPNTTDEPQAELWIGAHPHDSSLLLDGTGRTSGTAGIGGAVPVDGSGGRTPLADRIAADPAGQLGHRVTSTFGSRLPFLLKVLAVAAPLSLQAHPTVAQAQAGFDAEEALGIPVTAPFRNYKDRGAKPEMVCAVTPFAALCGFRPVATTVDVLSGLGVPALAGVLVDLQTGREDEALQRTVTRILALDAAAVAAVLAQLLPACRTFLDAGPDRPEARETATVALELAARYPTDPGVLLALLLNVVRLEPGEAMFCPAGQLHAYFSGVGVEIMGNSDNVLRGGLTSKHVDVPELLTVLRWEAGPATLVPGVPVGADEVRYPAPTAEFGLSVLELSDRPRRLPHHGAQILLVLDGELRADRGDGPTAVVERGGSLWIPADADEVTVSGPARVYRATDGLDA
jgi:mannose-6-phosphate isomerase